MEEPHADINKPINKLRVGVAHDGNGQIHINFGTDVHWISLSRENAIDFAKEILQAAGVTSMKGLAALHREETKS